jgi:AcrR family transcriptional regulator
VTTLAPPGRTLTPRAGEIIAAAHAILETEGRHALTMRRLADVLGIRAPSIYKHLPSKQAVEAALIDQAFAGIGEVLHRAARDSGTGIAVAGLLAAYRSHGLAHPNLYRLATSGPLPRHLLTPGLENWAGEPFFLVTGEPHRAQALWSFAHGMVILELDGRFPDGSALDQTWAAGANAFDRRRAPRR